MGPKLELGATGIDACMIGHSLGGRGEPAKGNAQTTRWLRAAATRPMLACDASRANRRVAYDSAGMP